MDDRYELYKTFQKEFPLESLSDMPLDKYTNLNKVDSFCFWVESKTRHLGSIWGGSSYKFGIYKFNHKPYDTRIDCDDKYAWYKKYNKPTAEEAYKCVLSAVVNIAQKAREGRFEEIDADDTLGDSYKWKIAFLYSDLHLIPIYKREMLDIVAQKLGMTDAQSSTRVDVQRFLISKKGDKDIFAFYDELLAILDKMRGEPAYWLYSPGSNASEWQHCIENGIMCMGWKEIGDFSIYKSEKELLEQLEKIYQKTNPKNDKCAIWDFVHSVKPGDVIFAKKGRNKIIGRGVVDSDYCYDENIQGFPNTRKVIWTIQEYDCPNNSLTPMKTLTNITKYPGYVDQLNALFKNEESPTEINYWWLVAKPAIWSLTSMKVGDKQGYTLYNDNGNQRRIFKNFVSAQKGDIVIGYEATPTKQIVALLEIEKENDGHSLFFKKLETLPRPIDFTEFKDVDELSQMEFLKNMNGSFFHLTKEEYNVLLDIIREENPQHEKTTYPKYTDKEFLEEVFLDKAELDTLKALVSIKKNVILQGPPGAGKTFAACKLAYVLMGEKDNSRIEQIQFHQNYTYEDFIMGYRPCGDGGFRLQHGVFYRFCRRAKDDPNKPYFFIIDEINRGNMSKIFGELLMLVENSYRGEKHAIKLAYSDEMFYIPRNLYIIGMMNTADRSLAMIDYALRRRFAFYKMQPAFESDGFRKYQKNLSNDTFDKTIEAIVKLNETIKEDDSLGEGFCIGHSYFCEQKKLDMSWLKNVLLYDIAPMLEEYWFDDKDKYKKEIQKLKDILND